MRRNMVDAGSIQNHFSAFTWIRPGITCLEVTFVLHGRNGRRPYTGTVDSASSGTPSNSLGEG